MNKSDLKNFAINARLELLQRVADRAGVYGIDEEKCKAKTIVPSASFHKLDGTLLTNVEIQQRNALIVRVYEKGYRQTMEEAAYTWFNRFIAIKYMQEHNLLPVRMRVLPDAPGVQPQMVREAQDVDLPGVDMDRILSMLDGNRTDELYKTLLIALCNALSEPLPGMFEKISDYTELLFPDGLLKADSVLGEMAKLGDDCWNEIQVIGWLYQYYNTQLKDETFELLKKNVKITKDRIGAATQLFTPEWIVNYMVENSLGCLWQEGHHDENLRMKWRYYMDEAQQEPEVAAKLAEIRKPYASMQPEQITVLDPCMGSGHILVYAFDVLMDIYRSVGYTDRDAVQSIVENNLYGLDIDDRAAQLAYFAVMMKACEYDRRFFRRGVQPHVCAIQESAKIDPARLDGFGTEKSVAKQLLNTFVDAKEYGSILHVPVSKAELDRLAARMEEMKLSAQTSLLDMADNAEAIAAIEPLLMQAEILGREYDVVITNPPYMGGSGMNGKLSQFVKDNYPDSKSDLFAVFIERCGEMLNATGYQAMITQHAWMFLSSYEKLRGKLQARELINMAHLGPRAFEEIGGEVVQTTAFVLQRNHTKGYKGHYARLIEPTTQDGKEEMFLAETNRYIAQQENFKKIPGMPVAYWVSSVYANLFKNDCADRHITLREGLHTGDNERFLREWYEVKISNIAFGAGSYEEVDRLGHWVPYSKGGSYRKWYGNNELIVRFDSYGRSEMNKLKFHVRPSQSLYFKEGATWSALSSGHFGLRYQPNGHMFDSKGQVAIGSNWLMIMALFNTKAYQYLADILMPTLDYKCGDVKKLPYCPIDKPEFQEIAKQCVICAHEDWDSFETSWDFKKHPLI